MSTSRPGSAMPGSGRSSSALATEKIVVFAPMPMASDSAAVDREERAAAEQPEAVTDVLPGGLEQGTPPLRGLYVTRHCAVNRTSNLAPSNSRRTASVRKLPVRHRRYACHAVTSRPIPTSRNGKAEHIEEGYEERGVSENEAERRAWATVNKMDHGGKKSGSGRGTRDEQGPCAQGRTQGRPRRGARKDVEPQDVLGPQDVAQDRQILEAKVSVIINRWACPASCRRAGPIFHDLDASHRSRLRHDGRSRDAPAHRLPGDDVLLLCAGLPGEISRRPRAATSTPKPPRRRHGRSRRDLHLPDAPRGAAAGPRAPARSAAWRSSRRWSRSTRGRTSS